MKKDIYNNFVDYVAMMTGIKLPYAQSSSQVETKSKLIHSLHLSWTESERDDFTNKCVRELKQKGINEYEAEVAVSWFVMTIGIPIDLSLKLL